MRGLSPKSLRKIRRELLDRDRDIENITPFIPLPGGQDSFWQLVFSDSAPRFAWLRGGINTGKSTLGAAWIAERCRLDPQARHLIVANDFPQLTRSTLVSLAEHCQKHNVPLEPTRDRPEETARIIGLRGHCYINGAFCYVISANNFSGGSESGRGIQVRSIWADELAYADEVALQTLTGRLGRGPGSIRGQGIITSSINRHNPYNWAYELFDSPDRTPEVIKLYQSIPLPIYENIYLDGDYIESLKASYTPELIEIELHGQFAATSEGRVFKYFDRAKNLTEDAVLGAERQEGQILTDLPLHISLDWNWNPATCIIATVNGDRITVNKEFFIPNADTFILTERLGEYLKLTYGEKVPDVYLYGDASGNQRRSSSRQTDWQITWETLRKYGIAPKRRYPDSNPAVIDTVNSTNALFYHQRLTIDKSCRELIRDCESVSWVPGADPPKIDKKSDLMRSHLLDCLRYLAHGVFPLNKPPKVAKSRYLYA